MHGQFRSAWAWALYVAAITVAGAPPSAAAPPPVAVLEPAQERAATRLFGTDRVDLATGVTIDGLALLPDRIELTVLVGGEEPRVLTLWPTGTTRPGALETPSGVVTGAEGIPAAAREALAERLGATNRPKLRWRSLVMEVDPAKLAAETGAVAAALRGVRRAATLPPAVASAVESLRDGRAEAVDDTLRRSLCGRRAPPPGSVSVTIAAGRDSVEGANDCPARDVMDALMHDSLASEPLARWADEPRILVMAAELAATREEDERAAALLRQALAAPLVDQAAYELARRWGWQVPGAEGGLPAPVAEPAPEAPTTWPWLAAMLLVLAVMAALVRDGPMAARAAVGVGVLLAAGTLLWLGSPGEQRADSVEEPGMVADAWLSLGRGTACQVSAPAVTTSSWQVLVRCPDGDAGVAVTGGAEEGASHYERTGAHSLTLMPFDTGGRVAPELERWVRRVLLDVHAMEGDGVRLAAPRTLEVATSRPSRAAIHQRIGARPAWQQSGLAVGGVLTAVALPCLLLLLLFALRDLLAASDARQWRYLVFAGVALTVGAHLLQSGRMVMVYSGYTQTAQLIEWEPLRYGAGGNWLYGPLLDLLGWDHARVQDINRVYGVVGTLLLAAWAAVLAPGRPAAALAALLFMGAAPIMWRDHASESILVGGWVMLAAFLYGLTAAAERPTLGLLAAPCAMLAAVTRPEFALALIPLGVLVLIQSRPSWSPRAWGGVALAGVAAALMAVPHLAYVQEMLDFLRRTGALPGLTGLSERFWSELFGLSGLTVAVRHGPVLLVAFLPFALALARGRRLASLGILAVGFAWTAFTRVDLPEVSMPRVHAPPWTLFAIVAALGFDALVGAVRRRWGAQSALMAGAALVLGYLVSAGASWPGLSAQTNADTEELLLRDTKAALPAGHVCLTTIDYPDPPTAGKTHRMIPGYLFDDSHPELRILGIGEFVEPAAQCPDGAYALLGMRCYMALREDDTAGPPPKGAPMVQACQSLRDDWTLEPVIEWDAPNYGDVSFPMYPDGPVLRVGLYRITGPR